MTEPRLGLSIATFRQDDAVCSLLDDVAHSCASLFERIFVVDSQGSGRVAAHVEERGYATVTVHDAPENLGSAGNLARRLELGAEAGLDWLFAINHDGHVNTNLVRRLLQFGTSRDRIGAAYPLRYVPTRDRYDFTGTQRLPLPFLGRTGGSLNEPTHVYWASSNGALYNLAPVREGLLPWADLWMGWEDLGYGWLLDANGWKQYVVPDALFVDDREYTEHSVFGKKLTVSDKPAWYAYYGARNLITVTRRNDRPWNFYPIVAARVAQEVALTVALKPNKAQRLQYIAAGVRDGLRGRMGKWVFP